MKLVLGKWAVDRVQESIAPEAAAQMAINRLQTRLKGHGGIILLDPNGRYGIAHNTPRMAWAVRSENEQAAGIHFPISRSG